MKPEGKRKEPETQYCNKCGKELVLMENTLSRGFNTTNGKRSKVENYKCPNKSIFDILGLHTTVTVYYKENGDVLFEDSNLGTIGD